MQDYKDLEIYQISHKLAIEIHKITLENLPKFEMYEEGSQIRRSSKSIPATIVEGFGRKQYQQEYIKYGSLKNSADISKQAKRIAQSA